MIDMKRCLLTNITFKFWANMRDGMNMREISKRSDICYSYLCKLLSDFEKSGIIEKQSNKIDNKIFLTEKGNNIKKEFLVLFKLLDEDFGVV